MASPKTPWLREGLGEGLCRSWLVARLVASAAGLASSAVAAAAARLIARAALSRNEGGYAALNLEPIVLVPPPLTQPGLALGLSLRDWMLKPLN